MFWSFARKRLLPHLLTLSNTRVSCHQASSKLLLCRSFLKDLIQVVKVNVASAMLRFDPLWETSLPHFRWSQTPLGLCYSVARCSARVLSLWAAKTTFGHKREAPGPLVAKRIHMTSLMKIDGIALAIAHTHSLILEQTSSALLYGRNGSSISAAALDVLIIYRLKRWTNVKDYW